MTALAKIPQVSGYDPDTRICWHLGQKGDSHGPLDWRSHRESCPACSSELEDHLLVPFGRCRSASRTFWFVRPCWREDLGDERFGYAESNQAAMVEIVTAIYAIRSLRPELFLIAIKHHGDAARKVKELNRQRRAARPPSNARDAKPTEYLYSAKYDPSDYGPSYFSVHRFAIVKRTAKRIFYRKDAYQSLESVRQVSEDGWQPERYYDDLDKIRYVDRQKLDRDGQAYNRGVHSSSSEWHVFATLEHLLASFRHEEEEQPDLRALKVAMAAAHPDRGGSSEQFIAARAVYEAARAHHASKQR
jgi:hypothetical protein